MAKDGPVATSIGHPIYPWPPRSPAGRETSRDGGGFFFDHAGDAVKAAEALGESITLPKMWLDKEAMLKRNKSGRLVMWIKGSEPKKGAGKSTTGKPSCEKPGAGWVQQRRGWWERVFDTRTEQKQEELTAPEYDNLLRCLYTPGGERAGWMGKAQSGRWVRQPKDDVKSALLSLGHKRIEADIILGGAIFKAWELVNLPFQPEYPGNRRWNRGAAQFRFAPAELAGDTPHHPHWDRILQHIGQDLTPAIRKLSWAKRANIKSGADYLLVWIACLLRDPFEPLPYLFLFGPENSGKSILHEAISLLMTAGVVHADRALTNKNDFNGELANAVLCVVEEKNISQSGTMVHNRIKEWVTGRTISIRKMRTDSYSQANTTHWIQCANRKDACPIFAGDTRITMIYVPDLIEDIPKKTLLPRLEEEAPHFMRTLMDMQLPPVVGRLRLPIVTTNHKQQAEQLSRNELEEFFDGALPRVGRGKDPVCRTIRSVPQMASTQRAPGVEPDQNFTSHTTSIPDQHGHGQ